MSPTGLAAETLPDGSSLEEVTPDNLPAHVDNNPDTCHCPVILTGPDHPAEACGNPVGWILKEVQDTYDSGYERLTLTGWVANGFWVICEDCAYDLDEPGWSAALPEISNQGDIPMMSEITDGFAFTYAATGKTGVVESGPFLKPGECNVRMYTPEGDYETTALAMDRSHIAELVAAGAYIERASHAAGDA